MPDNVFCETALSAAAAQYTGFLRAYGDPTSIPRSVHGNATQFVGASDWTSGFVAGSLWYLYEANRDDRFRHAAERWTEALIGQQHQVGTHDVGFMINSSFGNGLRLTQNAGYAQAMKTAAASLATRHSDAVGAIRSWDWGSWSHPVIIDNMMNLELLFCGTELGGSPRLARIAETHALTSNAHHFRADSSAYHLVDFNPSNGAVLSRETRQGLDNESVWARGQSWGLYGFTMAYRQSRNPTFLARANAIAGFLINSPEIPSDGVPYFDFSAPTTPGVPSLRDASAAAISASALFELQTMVSGDAKTRYLDFALKILRSLTSPAYCAATGDNGHFLLMHSVGDYPRGTELDAAINYADYYYLEALLRCRTIFQSPFWTRAP